MIVKQLNETLYEITFRFTYSDPDAFAEFLCVKKCHGFINACAAGYRVYLNIKTYLGFGIARDIAHAMLQAWRLSTN